MNVNLLIDALVRQTTVLIAQLATAAGSRAQLAHAANQVFLDLVHELKDQGLGNKVIADMFGLSLRTYHNKIARLAESGTDRGRSLWEAVFAYVQQRDATSRADLMLRFCGDDEGLVRGVLKDLVDSGLLFRAGRGDPSRADPAHQDCTTTGDHPVPVAVPVPPQLVNRPPEESVYCSCRCEGPAGQGPFCACPDGFECAKLVDAYGTEGGAQVAGSYCIKAGTGVDDPATLSNGPVCDRAVQSCETR